MDLNDLTFLLVEDEFVEYENKQRLIKANKDHKALILFEQNTFL